MRKDNIEVVVDVKLGRGLTVAGYVLIIIGILGMFLPNVLTVAISVLIAGLLISAGVVVGMVTWTNYSADWLAWLKPFVLIVLGLLILFHPAVAAATLGLVLVVYFLFDGFASIGFSARIRPGRGWGWMLFNGVLSLFLGAILLMGWPFNAVWMVGLIIGVSLFFDGVVLLMLGNAASRG
ncbi:MAG: HdeD family acid-resistance protein [Gammaproteobacteria bacterium]